MNSISKSKRAGPTVSEHIVNAVSASKERRGVTAAAIKKALNAGGYDVQKNKTRVNKAIKRLVVKGILIRTRGTGASGSFKINKAGSTKRRKRVAKRRRTVGKGRRTVAKRRRTVAKRRRTVAKRRRTVAKKRRTVAKRRRTVAKRSKRVTKRRRTVAKRRRTVVKRLKQQRKPIRRRQRSKK